MPYDYINFSCTLSSIYGTPGLYATLTDCENAVSDGSVKPVLILNPLWSASKKASLPLLIYKLGDGYQQAVFNGVDQINEEWSITSPILIGSQVNELLNQLRQLSGTSFLWSPNNGVIDYKEFTCDAWQRIRLGVNQYQITTTFKMTILGSGLLIPFTPEPPPAGSYLLDGLSTAPRFAYSIRRLRNGYFGNSVNAVRLSDSATQDIGFSVGGDLDESALSAFAGSADTRIFFYDQSGNSINSSQPTNNTKPRISNSSAIERIDGGGTKPAAFFSGSNHLRVLIGSSITSNTIYLSIVFRNTGSGVRQLFDARNSADGNPLLDDNNTSGFATRTRNNTSTIVGPVSATGSATGVSRCGYIRSATQLIHRLNGVASSPATVSGAITINQIGFGSNGFVFGNNPFSGYVSEFMLFDSIPSADDIAAIESSQASYFS